MPSKSAVRGALFWAFAHWPVAMHTWLFVHVAPVPHLHGYLSERSRLLVFEHFSVTHFSEVAAAVHFWLSVHVSAVSPVPQAHGNFEGMPF